MGLTWSSCPGWRGCAGGELSSSSSASLSPFSSVKNAVPPGVDDRSVAAVVELLVEACCLLVLAPDEKRSFS